MSLINILNKYPQHKEDLETMHAPQEFCIFLLFSFQSKSLENILSLTFIH